MSEAHKDADRGKWQPIATAPRDGTNILIRFGSDGVSQAKYVPGTPHPWKFIDTNDGITWLINHAVDTEYGPTHWMPFPEFCRNEKPVECAEGCPLETVCDYCAGKGGKDSDPARQARAASPQAPAVDGAEAVKCDPIWVRETGNMGYEVTRCQVCGVHEDNPCGRVRSPAAESKTLPRESEGAVFTPNQLATLYVALGHFKSSGSVKCADSIMSIIKMDRGDE